MRENDVRNFGIRLFTLVLCTATLLAATMIPVAKAGSNRGARVEKARTKSPEGRSADVQSPGPVDMRSPTLRTFPPPMYDDLDRKAGGGAGM